MKAIIFKDQIKNNLTELAIRNLGGANVVSTSKAILKEPPIYRSLRGTK